MSSWLRLLVAIVLSLHSPLHSEGFVEFSAAQQGMIAFAAGGGLVLSSPAVIVIGGTSVVAGGIYLLVESIRENRSHKKRSSNPSINSGSTTSSPQEPNNDNDTNFFKVLKTKADKIVRSKRFGKMYRDPQTKLWWSKDKSGHGGSCYKVFKEGSKGFEWQFDADALGNAIINKHKGPTWLFIPYKEVIF